MSCNCQKGGLRGHSVTCPVYGLGAEINKVETMITDYKLKSYSVPVSFDKDLEIDLDDMRKRGEKYIEDQVKKQITDEIFASSVDHAPLDLTLERLAEAVDKAKRYDHIYVMASEHIPDNAIGVLWVRPDDAKRMRK